MSVGEKIREFVRHEKSIQTQAEIRRDAAIAPDGKFDTTSREQQLGRPLHCAEIKTRLLRLNPNLHFELAHADRSKMGIYIVDGFSNAETPYAGLRYLMGMESGYSPEFSIRKVKLIPFYNPETQKTETRREWAGEVRGWRTVLAKLIRSRIVNQTQAEIVFQIHHGRESANWSMLLS